MAPDRARAEMAFDLCIATYEQKDPQAADGLAKDREVLWTCYDFLAEYWLPIRTTNPSTSARALPNVVVPEPEAPRMWMRSLIHTSHHHVDLV